MMAYLRLLNNAENEDNRDSEDKAARIMIFTEGTVLGPPNILQHFNLAAYIPISNSVNMIKSWQEQGAEVMYFTSRRTLKQVEEIKEILSNYNFPGDYLYYREKGQNYKDIVEMVVPDILIEDDCKSIGGKGQMCITHVKSDVKDRVKSVVVEEFKGIDHLPLSLRELLEFQSS